nr:L,D-transpeptidase family protein [Gemmatimonadota bacterium]
MLPTRLRHLQQGATLSLLLALAGCASLGGAPEPVGTAGLETGEAVRPAGKYVVIDLDVNELHFMHGETVLWSAPVGTGTGFRLASSETEWEFSTPEGLFHVQFKATDPVWVIPDWYFIENKLPIPPADSPDRKMAGGLGAAAVYLGDQIAIHGTDRPELLGQRVSHGCIRLSNANALRLFHNVQIGTPVVVRGGPDEIAQEMPDSAAAFTRPRRGRTAKPTNPLARITTANLLQRLDGQLATGDTLERWTGTASELISRGLDDDAIALRGLLI